MLEVLSGEMVATEMLQEDKLQMFRKCLFTTRDRPARPPACASAELALSTEAQISDVNFGGAAVQRHRCPVDAWTLAPQAVRSMSAEETGSERTDKKGGVFCPLQTGCSAGLPGRLRRPSVGAAEQRTR